ncbi:Protein of unknown function [Bacillus toyonensis]|nr:Protein of unknown function [Bacillus toyonensis]
MENAIIKNIDTSI